MGSPRNPFLWMAILVLAACASRPPIDGPTPELCVPVLGPADFPDIGEGFDLSDLVVGAEREILSGDKLVYGLRLEQDGEYTDLLLELTA